MAHPIENILKTTMEELRQMVDVNTIIGDPVMLGTDTVILPVSRVCLGFLSGGGEFSKSVRKHDATEEKLPFTGASVAGLNLTPIAFLTVTDGMVRVLPANCNTTVDRVIEVIPESIRQIEKVIQCACEKKKEEKNNEQPQAAADNNTEYPGA
ncbi:GerW family sporulation protein [Christensenellaceae bacterium OttesenSCG-928-M15]|nr:GerW family sporulation protein [Christensenellaceae bacterium OttesenSCG-928-M15]